MTEAVLNNTGCCPKSKCIFPNICKHWSGYVPNMAAFLLTLTVFQLNMTEFFQNYH